MHARIAPATAREMGPVNAAITTVLGVVAGTERPNLFTTLARHRRMFRPWLRFAATLMPGGSLPARDTELVILRVAQLCGCDYEWQHHVGLARDAGLTDAAISAVPHGETAGEWTPRQRALLRATDELHAGRTLTDHTWQQLRAVLGERELIELPMLVGHYEMLAMAINSLDIQPDRPRPSTVATRRIGALRARARKGSS